ncbi:MAG TPA: hypothetical protein VI588_05220, partial [Candidatus Gracilibacteria bacterium]|nr:hypothetical protein [Candidatus Gracilibacteria bacterium]
MTSIGPLLNRFSAGLLVSFFLFQVASAQFSIAPGQENRQMNFRIAAGQKLSGTALLRNSSSDPISVRVYASDGKKSTS